MSAKKTLIIHPMPQRQIDLQELIDIVLGVNQTLSTRFDDPRTILPKLIRASIEFSQHLTREGILTGDGMERDVIEEIFLNEMKKRV